MMSHFPLPEWAEVIEDPSLHIGEKVHVERWNPGAVFVLERYHNGRAFLRSPSRNRRTDTTLRLYKKRFGNE